jgi:hypothetical protein
MTTRGPIFVALCAFLAFAPAADAHSLSKGTRMVAQVTSTLPDGVELRVVSGDDELELRNASGRTIVVLGYTGEPYLRFDPGGGISANLRSPALALNATRFPPEREWRELTRSAPAGSPDWQRVDDGDSYAWVDHRIHLITQAKPPLVRADPGKKHLLRRWTVPLEVGGSPVAVRGTLRYEPGGFDWVGAIPYLVVLAAIAVAAISVAVQRKDDPEDD